MVVRDAVSAFWSSYGSLPKRVKVLDCYLVFIAFIILVQVRENEKKKEREREREREREKERCKQGKRKEGRKRRVVWISLC